MTEIRQHIISSELQFGIIDKIVSFKVHHSLETAICDETPYMQWYINHTIRYISLPTHSSNNEVSFTSILYICLSCVLIHVINPTIYVTICHKNLLSLLHNPTLVMLGLL